MAPIYSHIESNNQSYAEAFDRVRQRLISEGDTPLATLAEKLQVLEELGTFELGRYFVANQGFDGSWSHYIAYEFPRLPESKKPPKDSLERRLTEVLGDFELRVRLEMVKDLLQKELKESIAILSVPCGVMAALSTLDFSKIKRFKLVGVDLDSAVLDKAKQFSKKMGVDEHVELLCRDAWDMNLNGQFDVAISMGLNVFVAEPKQVLALYKSLYTSIKPGGKFMVSFMTPYSSRDPHTERDLSSMDPAAVRLQRLVVSEIVKSRVVNFCSSQKIKDQLQNVGFAKVDIHYSKCKSPNFAVAVK